jgi:hypothetical protein
MGLFSRSTGTDKLLLVKGGRVKSVPTSLHSMPLIQEISRLLRSSNVMATRLGTDMTLWHLEGRGGSHNPLASRLMAEHGFPPVAGTAVITGAMTGSSVFPLSAEEAERIALRLAADTRPAAAPADEDIAATVTADAPQAPPGRSPETPAPAPTRRGQLASGVAGVAIVLCGVGYAVYASQGPREPFPEATHELTTPFELMDGTYEMTDSHLLPPSPERNTPTQKDSTHFSLTYDGTGDAAAFRQVDVYGSSGRYKDPEEHRDNLIRAMTVTGREHVVEPPTTINVPGSDVKFRCTTVDSSTVCGWGDANTTVALRFTPTGPLDVAAAEASRIRDALRKPITKHP